MGSLFQARSHTAPRIDNSSHSGTNPDGSNDNRNLIASSDTNVATNETHAVSRSQTHAAATTASPVVLSNVALYPIQSLIVSLLIRLLNFIQTGSPRHPENASNRQVPTGITIQNLFKMSTWSHRVSRRL